MIISGLFQNISNKFFTMQRLMRIHTEILILKQKQRNIDLFVTCFTFLNTNDRQTTINEKRMQMNHNRRASIAKLAELLSVEIITMMVSVVSLYVHCIFCRVNPINL